MPLGDEQTLWCLVLLGILAVALYLFIRWVMEVLALLIRGYWLMSLGSFTVVAPIYWFFLFRNLFKPQPTVLPANA